MNSNVEIYFNELSEEKQEKLLDLYGIDSPEEANWDIYPVTTIFNPEAE